MMLDMDLGQNIPDDRGTFVLKKRRKHKSRGICLLEEMEKTDLGANAPKFQVDGLTPLRRTEDWCNNHRQYKRFRWAF